MANRWRNSGNSDRLYLGGGTSKITADGACSHEIKRHLLFGRQVMTNLSSVQLLSRVQLFATPWITACWVSLSTTNSWSLRKLMSIKSVMPSSHLILCHSRLLLPPISPNIRVFSNKSTLHMSWPKYWSFSFSLSPSKEHSGLISFRMDWLDLLVVVWGFFGIAFLWDWNENWPFPVLWPLLSFPNLLAYWVQHFHSIIFQDLK